MKKFISLLLCLVLIVGIGVTACAFNVDAIKPDTSTIIVGITGEDVPVTGPLLNTHQGSGYTIIVPPVPVAVPEDNSVNNTNNDADVTDTETDTEITVDTFSDEILNLTNKERAAKGLKELTYNLELQEAADLRAKEAAESFSHTRPNGKGCFTVINIDYEVAGENLVLADQPVATAETMMDAWMNSESHRYNILLEDFTSMAVGTYTKNNVVYAAQLFIG